MFENNKMVYNDELENREWLHQRISLLRVKMIEKNYQVVRIQDSLDMSYFIGFQCSGGTLFVTQNKLILLTDYRYFYEAKDRTLGIEVIDMMQSTHPFEIYGILDGSHKGGNFAYQGGSFASLTPSMTWINFGSLISDMRAVKDLLELSLIKKACAITDMAYQWLLSNIQPGMREKDIAIQLEYFMKTNGADLSMGYDIVVASGRRSSYAHGRASEKRIEKDDVVLVDFGCKVAGYCSDLSRTFFMGTASEKQREVYQTVLMAQDEAIKALMPGIQSSEIDQIGMKVATRHGYGAYYGIGIGHGVGLSIAESPTLIDVPLFFPSMPLKEGNVITVEPAIYLPSEFGVRIEDILLIKDGGSENFVSSNKRLIELNF